MYDTKSILPQTASFSAKLPLHEERYNSSTENIPKFTNHLVSNTERVNETFTFKESNSQHDRMEYLEKTSKEISAHENDKHWNLVRRRELNGNKSIMYI